MFLFIGLIIGVILLYLLFWPVTIKPVSWQALKPPGLVGEFALNEALAAAERLNPGGVGPEDVIFDKQGRLYTGLADGRIMRMQPDGRGLETFAQTGGRPLGLAFDAAGSLIVADADKGLLAVDALGQVSVLTDRFQGRKLVFTNHLDIAADGTIYFSESSDRYPLHDYIADILEGRPNGALLAYDPQSGETRMVLDDLYFANGVAVSPDQSFVLVAEGYQYRVQRVWLRGPRAGENEIFIENLPGFADNLHSNGRDIFWLALVSPRKVIVDVLADKPFLRKVIYRLPDALTPSPAQHGIVLGLDGDGRVLHNLQDPGGTYAETSCATEKDGMLYVGSFGGDKIGRLAL